MARGICSVCGEDRPNVGPWKRPDGLRALACGRCKFKSVFTPEFKARLQREIGAILRKDEADKVTRACLVLRLPDGRYVGSPTHTATVNPHLAACWTDASEADKHATSRNATVVPFGPEATAWFKAGKPRD